MLAIAPLGEDDALSLFESLSGGALGAADSEAARAARSVVRRLDALPLAVELAAARVPSLGVTEVLARLDRKLDVLGTAKDRSTGAACDVARGDRVVVGLARRRGPRCVDRVRDVRSAVRCGAPKP